MHSLNTAPTACICTGPFRVRTNQRPAMSCPNQPAAAKAVRLYPEKKWLPWRSKASAIRTELMTTATCSLRTRPIEATAPREVSEVKALWLAVCVNALLFAFALWAVTPCFETNDDLSMQLIASGFYTGHPCEYLVFTNVLLGWPLRLLYEAWPTCNWYLVYLIGSQYAAMTAVAFVVFSRRRHWLFLFLYLGFFLLAEMRLLVSLQFTTTAFLVGASALLLLVSGLRPLEPIRPARIIWGFALAGLMVAIREQAAVLLIV